MLYLIRHAQTEWNEQNRLQGQSDLPLSPRGLEQARCVGRYFAGRPIQALYTSHLQRSAQTAEAISRTTGVTAGVDADLSEIGFGKWEGLTTEAIDAQFEGAFQRWRTAPSQVSIPGGEPLEDFRVRVRRGLAKISQRHQEEHVAVVCHGGVIGALIADWLDADYDFVIRRVALVNGGISAIDHRCDPPSILWVNFSDHLMLPSTERTVAPVK